uniref:DUF295 domain-containing protein n=1 Tax=Betula platyphylla TaxID=78630 RepID=A0A5B9FYG9_BETPL|nr:hypothetical protein [Betula platyphylla]
MAPVSWSDLSEELQEMILRQPTDVVNLYRYRNVCRSWRSIVDRQLASSPPHLLLYEKRNDTIECIRLFNIFTGDSSVCKIPEFKTGDGQPLFPRSVHSCHGWVAMDCTTSDRDNPVHHIFLYNPLSSARIQLPTFKLNNSSNSMHTKFVLSAKQREPSSIALGILEKMERSFKEKMMFWKAGDEEWTPIVPPFEKRMSFADIISYKGGFCAIGLCGEVTQFELNPVRLDKKIQTCYKIKDNGKMLLYHAVSYLVESLSGDLLIVHRGLVHRGLQNEFMVYKLDWERMEWDEITSLGDEAIFFGRYESVCIRASESTVYRRNCIYFIDERSQWEDDFGMVLCFPSTPKKLAMTVACFVSGAALFAVGVHLSYVNIAPQQARTKARDDFVRERLRKKYGTPI